MPRNEILTADEVAELLRIHPATLYKMIKNGDLPAFRVGSDWRFSRNSIEKWLESRMQEPED